MSLTNELRPKRFSEVVGNEVNNKLLLAVARRNSPSTIVLSGSFGTGKTSVARLFAKALNCTSLSVDLCGKCSACTSNISSSPFYDEYDSSRIGRVENIRELTHELTFVPKGFKRVITFDEFHLASREAQSALLKVFEEAPSNVFYVLCTTEKNAILPTIISRSLVLEFHTKSKEEIIGNLRSIAANKGLVISPQVENLIALRSKGHMRDVHKLLEKYLIIGEDDFVNLEESGYTYLAKYFAHVLWMVKNSKASSEEIKKHRDVMLELVNRIMQIPISLLKDDYQSLFLDLMLCIFNPDSQVEAIVRELVRRYDNRSLLNLYKVAMDDFMLASFESDIRFQTSLLSIHTRMLMGI